MSLAVSKARSGYTSPTFRKSTDKEGFEHLMNNRNGDATIDIPLQDRPGTSTSYGNGSAMGMNEKGSYPQRRGVRKSAVLDGRPPTRRGEDGEPDGLTKMGHIYNKILNFSVFTRYFLYIIPVGILICIPIIVGATSANKSYIGGIRMLWVFVWILCSWVGLWGSKIVAHYLPIVFQAACGVVSANTRKYTLILKQLEIPLSLVGWALVTLATFKPLMTRNPTARADRSFSTPDWVNIVQQVLAAGMASALIFAGERLFIQIISINYHRKQFHARIRDSKRQLFLLGLLYDASRGMFPSFCVEFQEEDTIIDDAVDLFRGAVRKRPKSGAHMRSGSSTPMRMLQEVGNLGDKVTAAFGNVAHEVTGKQIISSPNSSTIIVSKALEKNRPSEALARRLWLSFVIEGHDALYLEDLVEVLGAGRQAEAEECFAMLDADGNGDVSLDEMILTVTQFGRERLSIANSMHDVDQAIKVLDRMLCTVIFIIVIFIFVAFLNHSFVTTLATAGTALLSLSFVFSATAAEFLGSCIFLFVKHPYDIGDRVDLNSGTDQMIVEHISLLFTVFRRIDSHRTVQIPNMILNTLWIENVTRSGAMKEQLSLYVAFDTTLEDIQILRNEMKKFVTAAENKRDFQDEITIEVRGVSQMDKLELAIEILHKSNWSNETVRAARRSKFMCALVLALRKVPIYGPGGGDPALGAPGNPSYSVAVTDVFASKARDAASQEKEGKRLVPTKSHDVYKLADTLGSPTELHVMTSLNERSPGLDGPRDAAGYRGTGGSPISPVIAETDAQDAAESGFLRRTTTKGRRKSNRSEAAASAADMPVDMSTYPSGTVGASGSTTELNTMKSVPEIPNIGVTQPSPVVPRGHYRGGGGGSFAGLGGGDGDGGAFSGTTDYLGRGSSPLGDEDDDQDWYADRDSAHTSGEIRGEALIREGEYQSSVPRGGVFRGT